jgi:hypothetical protein
VGRVPRTAQPLFREAGDSGRGPHVRIFVDEVGYQAKVAPDKASLYSRLGERPRSSDESTAGPVLRAADRADGLRSDVALLNFFHAVDETSLAPGRAASCCPTARTARRSTRSRGDPREPSRATGSSPSGGTSTSRRRALDVQDAAASVRRARGRGFHVRGQDHAAREHARLTGATAREAARDCSSSCRSCARARIACRSSSAPRRTRPQTVFRAPSRR